MAYFCNAYPVLERTEIAKGIFSYVINCPEVAAAAKAGQFVHIKAEGFTLRRPISICGIDREKGALRIVFEVRGGGTDTLSRLKPGDKMDIIAPLGNGFTVKEIPEDKNIVVVGGGIGVPPMLGISAEYKKVKAIIGFRSRDKVILEEDLKRIGADVTVCTDDGSYGESGVVTKPLEKELEKCNPHAKSGKGGGGKIQCSVRAVLGAENGVRRRSLRRLRLQYKTRWKGSCFKSVQGRSGV